MASFVRGDGGGKVSRLLSFLLAIMLAVGCAFQPARAYAANGSAAPISLFGWASAIVLTRSMHSVIPQGSLIVIREAAESDLSVGDDITFMTGPSTSVTHRIIEVHPDYNGTGSIAFTTKGVDNAEPDADVVMEDNVVGKVVFHSLALGTFVTFVQDNWPLGAFFAVLAFVCYKVIRRIFRPDQESEGDVSKLDNVMQSPIPAGVAAAPPTGEPVMPAPSPSEGSIVPPLGDPVMPPSGNPIVPPSGEPIAPPSGEPVTSPESL